MLSTTLPTNATITTTCNARGLFEAASGIDTYVSATAYTATGGIDQQTLGNGVASDFTYDEVSNRLERSYTYDTIGNLLSFRHRYPSAGLPGEGEASPYRSAKRL